MTKGQEKSDGLVVPEGRRKAVPIAREGRGGKEAAAREEVGQLELFRGTAASPRGVAVEKDAGRPATPSETMPKPRTTTRRAPPAMTMEEVANVQNLMMAFDHVASNAGAPGPDRQSIAYVLEHLATLLPRLHDALLEEAYRPGMVRRVWIPKPGGGQRGLGIPNVIDRVVQQAVHQVLGPNFDPRFHDASHGFRPGRSCHTAIADAKRHLEDGYQWVVDLDLEKFFDRVHHNRLLARLERMGVEDPRLIRLIRRMLKAKVLLPDGVVVSTDEGTPQGGPLSPLLSNVVLDELDWELERRGHRFVRYADDCNIYLRSERSAQRVMATISRYIERRLRLTVNQRKSAVARPGTRHFVGFSLQRSRAGGVNVRLSKRSRKRISRRIVELTRRNWGQSLRACIRRLNQYLRGWMGFFRVVGRAELYGLRRLDAHIRRRLRALVFRQKKRRRHIVRWLRKRGVPAYRARTDVYGKRRSLWALSITRSAHKAMSNYWFDQHGLLRLERLWRKYNAGPPRVTAPVQLELRLG